MLKADARSTRTQNDELNQPDRRKRLGSPFDADSHGQEPHAPGVCQNGAIIRALGGFRPSGASGRACHDPQSIPLVARSYEKGCRVLCDSIFRSLAHQDRMPADFQHRRQR
jgi:hypothetical protein